jgi:heat shock protein HtpX
MKINGARELQAGEEPRLRNVVEEMAIAAGVSAPRIYIMETDSMNAFATGMTPDHAAVGITRGLLEKLDRDELQSVIAHEMGHILNNDIRYATVVGVVVGMITIMSEILRRTFFFRGAGRSRGRSNGGLALIVVIASILATVAAYLVQMAISREREYLADATSVRLTRNPQGLIRALTKLTTQNVPFEEASEATQHLFIVNPFKNFGRQSSALFATHPSLDQRIERLKNLG